MIDFETRVTENQVNAMEALANIASIEDMIREADLKTRNAADAMRGADTSANLALTVALDAQKIAEEASSKASVIRTESGAALEEAGDLATSADSLANKLRETKEEVKKKEEVAREDGDSALLVSEE